VTGARWWLALTLLLAWSTHAAARAPSALVGLPAVNVAALASAAQRLYVAGFDDGLYVVEPDGTASRFQHPSLSPHINALAWSERTQTLWLGTARGLTRCRMTAPARCERLGSSSPVHTLLLRGDESLIAGGDAGLTFVGPTPRVYGKKQNAPFRSVWSLAEAGGQLFVGTTNGLFWGDPAAFALGGGKLHRAAVVLGDLPDDWVTALLATPDQLLVGTYNAGVVRFALGSSKLVSDARDRALGYVNPAGLFALGEQRLAVASMDGLHTGVLGRTTRRPTKARDVTAIAPARGGGWWIGTRRGLEWVASLAPEPS
jgi:ligand-binding sensor domain-containing protein